MTEMLRVPEVAALLGVSRARVYQLIAARELPSTIVGRAIRVPRPAWDAWLARHSQAALHHTDTDHATNEE